MVKLNDDTIYPIDLYDTNNSLKSVVVVSWNKMS